MEIYDLYMIDCPGTSPREEVCFVPLDFPLVFLFLFFYLSFSLLFFSPFSLSVGGDLEPHLSGNRRREWEKRHTERKGSTEEE
jgi:hypothetical protein